MPLVGTISGSNGTTTSAVTGSLIISNTTAAQFPSIASDTILYVSGVINGTSKAVIGGDLVVSGTTNLKGNLVLSGTNVLLGGNVTFNSDILYLDKTNARVGIGTSSPDSDLTVKTSNSNNIRGVLGVHYDNTTAFSQFKFIGSRARGSVGSPAAVQANDSLASFNGRGYKQNSWSDTVGGLYVYAKENWTNTNTPTYIALRGVAQGAGNAVNEWARIDNSELVVTGTIIASGTLKSLNSVADEGGEIFLNKSVTNTTLNTGLTIDVYQNRLRIFETGGTNRGGYWDISTLAAGVATNLAGGSPGGSNTQVQFNDGGSSFGGDAGLTYNKTTDTLSIAGGLNLTGSLNASGSLTFSFSNTGSLGAGAYANFTFGTQSFVGVDTRINDYTGTLPLINNSVVGRTYMVKDIGGNCGVKNFVIEPSSPNKIDGATQLKIQSASGSITLVAGYDPTDAAYNWYIMSVS